MCLTFDGKLHISPAGTDKPLHRVLDAGTGTGIWALDFGTFHLVVGRASERAPKLTGTAADEHPETQVRTGPSKCQQGCKQTDSLQVLGNDLSPIQPSLFVPPSDQNPSTSY